MPSVLDPKRLTCVASFDATAPDDREGGNRSSPGSTWSMRPILQPFDHLAYSTLRTSRKTVTLISPGYVSSDSIFFAMSRASLALERSSI